jgi:hypothetical protein
MQGVEGVEKGLLSLVFSLQELNIVDQENVDIPIFGLECRATVILNRINEVVGELFRRYVANLDFWIKTEGIVPNSMLKMGLTKP